MPTHQLSALSLRTIVSHKTLSPIPDEQAYYALLEILPAPDLPQARLPLNLCLVIDRSTSMRGERLQQVKQAIHHIIDNLRPEDRLSLVAFSDKAQLLLPGQSHVDPATAKSIVNAMQSGGGTEILPALQLGLEQVKRGRSKQSVNHLILLTDGQTYGDEQDCLEQAKRARAEQIHFSALGLGSDWNEDFLDQMAALATGTSIYINSPDKIKNIFSQMMRNLQTIITRQLTLALNLYPPVHLHEAYQIGSQISRLEVQHGKTILGTLSVGQKQAILMEFRMEKLTLGEQKLMDIIVEADISRPPQYRSWEQVELTVDVGQMTQPHLIIPPTLKTTLKKLVIYKMEQKVTANLATGQIGQATRCLKIMASQLFDLGQTDLACTVLREADNLTHSRTFSAEGGKKIRYDTRLLFTLPDEASSLDTMSTDNPQRAIASKIFYPSG